MGILDLLSGDGIQTKRAAATNGGEFASPCPRCTGSDRFRSWPEANRWMCRGCNLSGDLVEYLREYRRMSCSEAHRYLDQECESTACPAKDKCPLGNAGGSYGSRPLESVQPKTQQEKREWKAGEAITPEEMWQVKAQALVERAHAVLLETPDQLQYLAERGLPIEAVKQYQLGLVPKDFWRARESWGLPTEMKKNGQGKDVAKKLWIPSGILIPFFDGGTIHRLRIRRPEGEPRYYWVPGSGNDTFLLGEDRQAFIGIESDLDGMMIHYHAGDLVGVVCIGNTTAKPKQKAASLLHDALHILVSLDFDEQDHQGKRAGAQASKWWLDTFEHAERWPVPVGKDPGDAFKAGVDIRDWILEGLPPVFHVPDQKIVEPEKVAPVDALIETEEKAGSGVVRGVSKNGFVYFVVPDKEKKKELKAENEEAVVFTYSEVEKLRGMNADEAEIFINAQIILQGDIVSHNSEANRRR